MGCALLRPSEAAPGIDREAIRRMAHQKLDEFLEVLFPVLEKDTAPKLRDISTHVTATRSILLGGIMKCVTEEVARHYVEGSHADCPRCGKHLQMKRFDAKHVSTMNGAFDLRRGYFYCKPCGYGFHPMDDALDLAREVHQYDIQATLVRFAAEVPYDRASELFQLATGLSPGPHFGHDNLNRIGESTTVEIVMPSGEEIVKRIESAAKGSDRLPILVAACDGAHAPTRPKAGRGKRGKGEWREVKGFRLYLLGEDGRIIHLAGWHQIQNAEQLAKDLEVVAARIPREKVRIALLGDGADWVWNVMRRAFPEGREVLDYYHVSDKICKVAKLQYGDTLTALEWKEATVVRLYLDNTGYVIGGLRRMKPAALEVAEEVRKLIGYLTNHSDKFGYQECVDEGIPIGSGGIESANKYISNLRLKVSGAWWLEVKGNAMLSIRCAIYNGTFEQVFKQYVAAKSRTEKTQ